MRRLLFLLLLLLLTACSAFPLAAGKTGRPVDPLAAPEVRSNAPKVPEPLAASVLLALWNEGEGRHEIRPVDPATGEPVPEYPPLLLAESYERALSSDGSRLAAIAYQGTNCDEYAGGTRCRPGDG
ncbi:MAG TPA: hypothetical protein VER55_04935, partial [Ardenticatenaceae bacterium]|nr:hypothetical protein [Ardenticatenaceae bacterium]